MPGTVAAEAHSTVSRIAVGSGLARTEVGAARAKPRGANASEVAVAVRIAVSGSQ